ncbi:uncharacterized protein LOC123481584 [Coregonus clupeaformis]|uniref:uncharacterized protein LOC123481584 n=1 Tax=Coregonus clupeaformis TaxID=59861 RepID=UPI001E1C3789|nr:uncharacterized protein LOC123481584 [Coregonus clupeaformis]
MGTVRFTITILLTLVHQTESSSVFVQKGQDVRLDVLGNVQLKKDIDVLFWKFNTTFNVAKYPPKVTFERFKGRAEISEGNLSLLLKNIQEGDSGTYTAVVSGNKNTNVATYLIEVQAWEEVDDYYVKVWIPVGGLIVFVLLFLIGVVLWQKMNKGGKKEMINTEYASVRIKDNGQAGGEEQVCPASPTIYSMVGGHRPKPVNRPTMVGDQPPPVDLPMTSMPESLYAEVGNKEL